MSEGPQYTSCVEAANFKPLNKALIGTLAALIVAGGIGAIFSFGITALISIAALVQLLRYVLDFMLNGKLICLHRNAPDCHCGSDGTTVCAIGEVADTEEIGEDKNSIEDVDNDYSMNVILAPFDLRSLVLTGDADKIHAAVTATEPQGDLLREQPGMPKFSGYFRTMVYQLTDNKYHAWTEIVGRDYGYFGVIGPDQQEAYGDYLVKNVWLQPKKASIPTLHCEFEGTRIRDMLAAIEAFSLGGKWCKENWLTRFACVVLQTIFAPLALAAVGIAWAAAKDGTPEGALVGGGTISSKEWVVLRGRWVYDGGHQGWNEVHATRVVQKVDRKDVPSDPAAFRDYWKRWCERLGEVPHAGTTSAALTPEQQTVADNQQAPENQWVLHPEVDGCEGSTDDDPRPPIH